MWEPFGSIPVNHTVSLKPGPTERGTLNILSTCLITLGLCLWSALHLNIPEHGKPWDQIRRKTLWFLLGLFAPELVAYSAFSQWNKSRKLTTEINYTMGHLFHKDKQKASVEDSERSTPDDQKRKFPWTAVHSHYAVMGGFAFDTSPMAETILPNGRSRLTLTIDGLLYLAEYYPHLIPDLSESTIWDKSKASALAKSLVCLQALWFCLQVIGRLSSNLPISLLELNTFVHALCCLAVYLIWWNKPLDIEEPSLVSVTGEETESICAWMCMTSSIGMVRECRPVIEESLSYKLDHSTLGLLLFDDVLAEHQYWINESNESNNREQNLPQEHTPDGISGSQNEVETNSLEAHGPNASIYSNRNGQGGIHLPLGEHCYGFRFRAVLFESFSHKTFSIERNMNFFINLHRSDLLCLELATNWVVSRNRRAQWRQHSRQEHKNVFEISCSFFDKYCQSYRDFPHNKAEYFLFNRRERLTPRTPNCSFENHMYRTDMLKHWWIPLYCGIVRRFNGSSIAPLMERIRFVPFWCAIMTAGSVYGGLHLIAWNAPFSTRTEAILWKISGLILVTPFAFSLGFVIVIILSQLCIITCGTICPILSGGGESPDIIHRPGRLIEHLINASVIAFILARIYLVIESFINLAHLPEDVYKVPAWNQYIPHIGAG